jgi:hypothetical protein
MKGEIMTKEEVKCNNCDFIGNEDDLEMFKDDGEYFKGCPNCKTDSCLMDVLEMEVA